MTGASSHPVRPSALPDEATLERAIRDAPFETLDRLARHFTPAALRAARLSERNGLLVRMLIGQSGDAGALAEHVHGVLSRYQVAAWRYERDRTAPSDARNMLAHRILKLSDGEVLATRSLRRIFADVAKKTSGNGQASHPCSGP